MKTAPRKRQKGVTWRKNGKFIGTPVFSADTDRSKACFGRTEDGECCKQFSGMQRHVAEARLRDAEQREMLIGGRRFCITSVFPAEPSATATDKLLAYIDAELKKEAHSA